jgi:hypothetical protein
MDILFVPFFLISLAILGGLLSLGISLGNLSYKTLKKIRERSLEDAAEARFPLGAEAIFRGRYLVHWDTPSFTWDRDGNIWNHRNLRCELVIPYEGGWKWMKEGLGPHWARNGFQIFEIEFRGKIIEKGSFGNRGICRYRIEVMEMLSAHPVHSDSASLLRSSDKPEPSAEELLRPAKESTQTDPHTLLRPSGSDDTP